MAPVLRIEDLEAGYGSARVLFSVSLRIEAGEVTALMGRNGMGKTTLIRSILGLATRTAGRIFIEDRDVSRWPGYRVARTGVGLVPEGRQVFRRLSVEENLLATARSGTGPARESWTLQSVYTLFPRLAERRDHGGHQLSGGEQQMLAIGRALMSKPRLLLLDEPSLGLAPIVIQQIFDTIEQLRQKGMTIFLVEQNANQALKLADRGYVLENGRVVLQDTGAALLANPAVRQAYLGG
jgi:branched-chain amino acid transport system ATP-binding protein